jgi:L-seryl-tRNA(Ser) seleniumtransferase
MTGARLIEAGDAKGTTASALDQAIGSATAAVFFPAHLDGVHDTVGLGKAAEIAHGHGVPLLVDAAYLNYPTEIMGGFIGAGADLVCFSAKYFLGPNSGGLIVGREDLIDAVAGVDFTRYESGHWLVFGRPFKLDRQIIVGTVVALQEWLALDHGARFAAYGQRVAEISDGIAGVAGISSKPMLHHAGDLRARANELLSHSIQARLGDHSHRRRRASSQR